MRNRKILGVMGTISRQVSKGSPSARKRWISIVAIGLLVLVLLGSVTLVGASIYFSNRILQVPDYTTPVYDTPVLAVSETSVTLKRKVNNDNADPGQVFEIEWPAGYALVGSILSSDQNAVTRQILQKTGPLSTGTLVFWTRYVYTGQLRSSLGVAMKDVKETDALGTMP